MISGPLATRTLGDQGADVIKVEAPSGDHARHVATRRGGFSASFVNNNRNKRSIVLNLKNSDGLETLKRLAAQADVIIQNFRPGVAERIGVGEAAIRAVNEQIIYVSIAGFGFDGPYANKPVFDPLIQAVSGLTTVQAGSDEPIEEKVALCGLFAVGKGNEARNGQDITGKVFPRSSLGIQ